MSITSILIPPVIAYVLLLMVFRNQFWAVTTGVFVTTMIWFLLCVAFALSMWLTGETVLLT